MEEAFYNSIVARVFLAVCFLASAFAAPQTPKKLQTPPPKAEEVEPPEEDESLKPKEYALNPLEAERNITAGNFYFKKGNYRAAAKRFLEASRWDPGSAEAFLKLGETDEKVKDLSGARDAYSKYLEISPDSKNAAEIKKKISKWPAPAKK
jgi:tetratricopeptide (TPR) repeat protein